MVKENKIVVSVSLFLLLVIMLVVDSDTTVAVTCPLGGIGVCDVDYCCSATQDDVCPEDYGNWGTEQCGVDDYDCCGALDCGGGSCWDAGGWPGEFSGENCCTNDAGENYRTRQAANYGNNKDPSFDPDSNDKACCDNVKDCIYSGNCFTSNYNNNPAGFHDGDVVAGEKLMCESGVWYDCDNSDGACTEATSTGRCGLYWVAGGETSSFGEYDTGTSEECCEDDASESYTLFGRYTSGNTAVAISLSTKACCSAFDHCVDKDNNCVDTWKAGYLASSVSNDWIAACGGGDSGDASRKYWIDCDYSSGRCGYCNDYTSETVYWIAGGETSSFGEYDTGTSEECCGDDDAENYVDPILGDPLNESRCCSDAADYVWNGNCHSGCVKEECDYTGNCIGVCTDSTCYDGIDNDNDGTVDFCQGIPGCVVDTSDEDCLGRINISVYNKSTGLPLENAYVRIVQKQPLVYFGNSYEYSYSDYTDSNGLASFVVNGDAGNGRAFDIFASKEFFEPQSFVDARIGYQETSTVSFYLESFTNPCLSDCTKGDNLCHAECDLWNGCYYYNGDARDLCDGKQPGFIVPYSVTQNLVCCEGDPYEKPEALTVGKRVEAKRDVIRVVKTIILDGELVNMIIDIFG